MGLDITAYSHLERVGKHLKDPELNEGEPGGIDDWCYYEGHVSAYAYSDFPQSFRGVPILGESRGFIEGGCYVTTDKTEDHDFRAGSYTGYNQWRADLQEWFNPRRLTDGPFYELIWFADNEGTIGPEAAADLLADFQEHADAYTAAHIEDPATGRYSVPDGDWFIAKYKHWTRAFELAAADGLVKFH